MKRLEQTSGYYSDSGRNWKPKQVSVNMDLSPNDVRNFEFPNQMRGYDKDDVNSFKDQVADSLETARQENLKLSMEIESLQSQLAGLRQFEETIKNAAIDARRNADMTVANARQEAELILSKAKAEAERELSSRTQQVDDIEEQITKLELTKRSYLSKVRNLIKSHLELVEEIGETEGERRRSEDEIEVTSSSEVDRSSRETVASQPAKQEAIKTEEANAPEAPNDDLSESSKEQLSEALKSVLRDDGPEGGSEEKPEASIDPELAAALESYKAAKEQEQAAPAPAPEQPVLKSAPEASPSAIVETEARAEDIPPGFIAIDGDNKTGGENQTDKVQVPEASADESFEHNTIDPDQPEEQPQNPISPDKLANELDQVVAKFEEELDKAEQT